MKMFRSKSRQEIYSARRETMVLLKFTGQLQQKGRALVVRSVSCFRAAGAELITE